MKNLRIIAVSCLTFLAVFACKKAKSDAYGSAPESTSKIETENISDSISSVATLAVKDRQFIKTASVSMEVKELYPATIGIEKLALEMNGFVIHSEIQNSIFSEETFNTSDQNAILLRKFQPTTDLQVRIPTEKLGEFLQNINKNSIYLQSRLINAEDVTATIKMAELEKSRIKKTGTEITQLKTDKDKVLLSDANASENNQQELASLSMKDQLEYSLVQISLKEPGLRVIETPISNTKNIDNKYKYNFFFDLKNAVIEGFYLTQSLIIGLVKIWPLSIIILVVLYFVRKKKKAKTFDQQD